MKNKSSNGRSTSCLSLGYIQHDLHQGAAQIMTKLKTPIIQSYVDIMKKRTTLKKAYKTMVGQPCVGQPSSCSQSPPFSKLSQLVTLVTQLDRSQLDSSAVNEAAWKKWGEILEKQTGFSPDQASHAHTLSKNKCLRETGMETKKKSNEVAT